METMILTTVITKYQEAHQVCSQVD